MKLNLAQQENKQIVVITGATGPIGMSIAEELAKRGYSLAMCCRSRIAHLQQVVEKLEERSDVRCYSGDLTVQKEAKLLCSRIQHDFGVPNALVLCSGPIRYQPTPLSDTDVWEDMYRENVISWLNPVTHFLPEMKIAGRGRILGFGFSGVESRSGFKQIAAYAASKEALLSLCRSVAREVVSFGITVNMISPGIAVEPGRNPTNLEAKILEKIPMGRFGLPSEIAALAAWLLSDQAACVTGQNIKVSGGLHI